MQKLGHNLGGYLGETIDIAAVLGEIERYAYATGWRFEALPTDNGLALPTWHRVPSQQAQDRPPSTGSGQVREPRARIYISAGIHGDEPAGPLAVRQLLKENHWPKAAELCLCPCLNPAGFTLNRRENAAGLDLNRQYLHLEAPETRAHVAWLQRQPPFHLALCLHEDWEAHGFYLYELNPHNEPSQAEEIIRRVAGFCPIDQSTEIEGRPAVGGIVRPNADPRSRAQWPESLWLINNQTRHSYTLEAPSDFPLPSRVTALVTAVHTVLNTMSRPDRVEPVALRGEGEGDSPIS